MWAGEYGPKGNRSKGLRRELHESSLLPVSDTENRPLYIKDREQQQSRKKQKAYEQQSQIRARKEKAVTADWERASNRASKENWVLQQAGVKDPSKLSGKERQNALAKARAQLGNTGPKTRNPILTPQQGSSYSGYQAQLRDRKAEMLARLTPEQRAQFEARMAAKKAAQQVPQPAATPQVNTPTPSVMTGVGKETQAANNAAKQAAQQTAKTTAQNTATNMAKNNSIFNRRNAYIAGGLVGAGILGGYLYNRSKKNNRDRE